MFIHGAKLTKELEIIRNKGELTPVPFGFETWQQWDKGKFLQASRGSTILIGGEPHHGKTQFTNELLMQLMEKHDFKVALFSAESGNIQKVFSIFYGLYIGKQYSKVRPDGKQNFYAMSDEEKDIAHHFVNNRLFVFKQNNKIDKYQSLENFFKEVTSAEKAYDIKFDCVCIDPIYDIDDFVPKAEEVKRVLTYINQECEVNNRVDIIVNHVSETAKYVDKSGNRRKLRALADEFYGGKNNQRKAMLQILVERPIPNLNPEDAADYTPENQTNIHVLKAKPEGVAKMGVYPIFYDWKSRRYYEFYDNKYTFANCSRIYHSKPQGVTPVDEIFIEPKDAFENEEDIPF